MPTLYILCGPSGSGKTTWAKDFIKEHQDTEDIRYVSRDDIRFYLLNPEDEYFAHENEVFWRFMTTIRQTLIDGFDCIADATHLNPRSRRKLIHAIDAVYTDYNIVFVSFNVDIDTCLKRNAARIGRSHVPEEAMRSMYQSFIPPGFGEDARVKEVIKV
jgi:predicted kinase